MDSTLIEKLIDFDKNYIKDFVLDTSKGTKKVKAKFHKNAVLEKNKYVNDKIKEFNDYRLKTYHVITDRVNQIMPSDRSKKFGLDKENLCKLEDIIKFTNVSNNDYKLGFCKLIQSINDDEEISLEKINEVILEFINKFNVMNIKLEINDFSYSMFTKKYMSVFFENTNNLEFKDLMKNTFEDIYFECPDILIHLKLNLFYILSKYKNRIDLYTNNYVSKLLEKEDINKEIILSLYCDSRTLFEEEYSSDPFYILNMFLEDKKRIDDYLDDSLIRRTKFDRFCVGSDFSSLTEEEKFKYYSNINKLEKDLYCLKEFYRYEFLIKDLRSKYLKIKENRDLYNNKLKEIISEEKNRNKIYKEYLRANGIGVFAKHSLDRINTSKLKINEQIKKLNILYKELHDLEINVCLEKKIDQVSSLYDLFVQGYSSYYYLENMFNEHFKEDEEFFLEDEINRFFRFVYSPNNLFLRKLNGINESDICDIISDKYRILGINIKNEDISPDNIYSVISDVEFITLVNRVKNGTLSFENIKFICDYKKIESVDLNEVDLL